MKYCQKKYKNKYFTHHRALCICGIICVMELLNSNKTNWFCDHYVLCMRKYHELNLFYVFLLLYGRYLSRHAVAVIYFAYMHNFSWHFMYCFFFYSHCNTLKRLWTSLLCCHNTQQSTSDELKYFLWNIIRRNKNTAQCSV